MPLSYSQLRSYRTCPRQYEFATIKKLPKKISAGESFGSSVHNTLKKWGEQELGVGLGVEGGNLAPGQQQLFAEEQEESAVPALTLETLRKLWHQSFIVEGYASRVEADAARLRGEKLMEQYFAWWREKERVVVGIEKSFKIGVGGGTPPPDGRGQGGGDAVSGIVGDTIIISGRFDRIERISGGLHVIDYKTTKPCTQDQADADLQLSIYASAVQSVYKEPCSKLTLLFLNEEDVTLRETERTEGQLRDAERQMQLIAQRIESRDFHPTPSKEACGRCPYAGVCDAAAV